MHGFHNGQDELLLIADEHGTTVSAVADLLSIRASTVSKMSDRLVQRGLVERVGDADDGRRTMIRITTMGIQAQKELLTVRDQLENDLTKCLDADRKVEIIQSLQELAVLLVARLRRLR
ncbi:hypothetical protein ASG43_07360 [Aureimonas sp. Leaf454]|uniref:MarR family winged helix-turn-helix transcriptional regulator n=1 Tax=Aureimonas sp. Leaf454 TaxID=1736381 RepID=UPI0006F725E4|nr:MarR family transcriptional regulator [Aureimonas sp. Leaf454]KQT48681.1 hypothetical protein ASG43_07360 [Aureimonas sp. Leaf454]